MSQEGIEQRLLERFRTNYLAFVEAFNRRDLEAAFARTPPRSRRAAGVTPY
jgi:hypothetical protein